MYNLCSQHLQNINSVQQKLFVLQPLKDMFQMRPPGVASRLGFSLVTALIRPELPRLLSVGYLKDRMYEHNLQTIPDLKAAIRAERGEQEGHWELC